MLNHVLFAEGEYATAKTYLRVGARLNYYEKFKDLLIEPRINLRYKFTSKLAFQLQGEFKNQSTSQVIDFQDDFLGVENRRWVLANETTIPIAKSMQASLGFEYNTNNWLFDIQGFYKTVDGITVSNQGFFNNFQFVNAVGSYNAKGIELLVNKTADKFSTWASYTYALNDYEFNSLTPSVFPNNADIRHSISLAFNYNILRALQISIGGIWRSGQPFTVPVDGNETVQDGNNSFVNFSDPNAQNLEDFQRIDLSLAYNFDLSEKVQSTLRVGVLNVLNKKNNINTYYEVDPNDNNSALKIENNSLRLTPNVSFRCKF